MTEIIKKELYNGGITINFYPKSHRYKLDGEKPYLTSVTAITGLLDKSRALVYWAVNLDFDWLEERLSDEDETADIFPLIDEAKKQHTIKKKEAADFGTQIHEFAEQFGKYKLGECEMPVLDKNASQEVKNGIQAFIQWYNDNDVEFIACERMVYSKKHNYVGLLDAFCKVNGELTIVDYKSSKGIYNEMLYQVAAYRAAYNEESPNGEFVEKSIILKFGKEDGKLSERKIDFDDNEKNFKAFLGLLEVKKREKELYKYNTRKDG